MIKRGTAPRRSPPELENLSNSRIHLMGSGDTPETPGTRFI